MDWVKPEFSKGKINRAGQVLINPMASSDEMESALDIINNWRASHYYPLNTFKVTLRRKSEEIDPHRLVAQRIKRLSSIDLKLRRFDTMNLCQMQDIGGCRAIVSKNAHVRTLVKKYVESDLKHSLDDMDDYVSAPKESGYRGVHMIYKYFSDKQSPSIYNGLFIEVQIRSRMQHYWATAVETVGTFLKQSLKSSQGEEDWLRFFALMGSVLAIREKSPLVPNTPSSETKLISELRHYTKKLNVRQTLRMYGTALQIGQEGIEKKGDHYFLLKLEPKLGKMTISGFPRNAIDLAQEKYAEMEIDVLNTLGSDVVLVSADDVNSLRRAYPNYFLDTHAFLLELERALKR